MLRFSVALVAYFVLLTGGVSAVAADSMTVAPGAQWVWVDASRNAERAAYFRKTFTLDKAVQRATLYCVNDFNRMAVWLNGQPIADLEDYGPAVTVDTTALVRRGDNTLAVRANGSGGPSAVALTLEITSDDGTQRLISSDSTWLSTSKPEPGWQQHTFEPRGWTRPNEFGVVNIDRWGQLLNDVAIRELDDYTQWEQALGADASTNPATFLVAPGFQIELVRSAQKDEDSWVSLAFDPRGRIVIAKESRGLLRLTMPDEPNQSIRVESINDTFEECRGLLFAHRSLYVNANNSKALYRLRDTNGDDRFDDVRLLYRSGGGVGHGRNDLALGPDGLIYSIHGDAVDLPTDFVDRTSPFREHRRGKRSREGHLIRTDADGRTWELIAGGLRNPFGVDFNTDGEPFTYDADAEFDMGSPWYRPTRVNHLVSGGDYGWRGVTGEWPPYFPDHPDNALPNLDIGKGSPTAVKFGTKSNFPPRYRRALFMLDWAYGRIMAVHMTPRGASYVCRAETFVKGRPLNVTDLDFGPDGAMYVVTGGRKTQSGLYRISYVGPSAGQGDIRSNKSVSSGIPSRDRRSQPNATVPQEDRNSLVESPLTPQELARVNHAREARALRRKLESFHGQPDRRAIDVAWPYLGHPDPWIRHAARIAIEHQPVGDWEQLALDEPHRDTSLTVLMALARSGTESVAGRIVSKLAALPWADLTVSQKLTALHTYRLCVTASDVSSTGLVRQVAERLDAMYPDDDSRVNWQLSRLLVSLGAESAVPKTMDLLKRSDRQQDQFNYIFALRNAKNGWTADARRTYFQFLRQMQQYQGGQGLPGFIENIRNDVLANLTAAERTELVPLLEVESNPREFNPSDSPPRPFVRNWTVAELADSLPEVGRGRDYERGRQMFAVASCSGCHRLGAVGTSIGPTLTSVANRFSRRDVLESIINPSQVVADDYRNVKITTTDGQVLAGRILPGSDYRSPTLRILTDPSQPGHVTQIAKSRIESFAPSGVSFMPEGLVNILSKTEILDLLAYIESGGNRNHPCFAN